MDAKRIARLTQELGRREGSHASDCRQARARELHECANATLECVGLGIERSKPDEFRSGELGSHAAHAPQEPSHCRHIAGGAEIPDLALVACAVEVRGRIVPEGVARRFSWFLVTALPMREEIASGQRAVIADFLEAQGEPGLAARLRQF